MTPLAPLSSPKLLLSFDFDGTLHNPADRDTVSPRFFEIIQRLREENAALWGINTGRSMPHVVEGLNDSKFPFTPDWVVAREREIWLPDSKGRWGALQSWNRKCEEELHEFFIKTRTILDAIRHEVEEHTGATWIDQPGDPAGLIARTEEEMAWILTRVESLTRDEPMLGWQRNSIWLRFGHKNYQKGSSLAAVGKHFGISRENTFAIGDSHNDFDMLCPKIAACFACPANAVLDIREHVIKSGGFACTLSHSDGCVEALEHYFLKDHV